MHSLLEQRLLPLRMLRRALEVCPRPGRRRHRPTADVPHSLCNLLMRALPLLAVAHLLAALVRHERGRAEEEQQQRDEHAREYGREWVDLDLVDAPMVEAPALVSGEAGEGEGEKRADADAGLSNAPLGPVNVKLGLVSDEGAENGDGDAEGEGGVGAAGAVVWDWDRADGVGGVVLRLAWVSLV
ncbi:hypothetical protein B0H12DRAFT_747541 [Mycena haematopus]|nr:hypothetical protein B0H12DRAFT_747541 [Mycena haematopus]